MLCLATTFAHCCYDFVVGDVFRLKGSRNPILDVLFSATQKLNSTSNIGLAVPASVGLLGRIFVNSLPIMRPCAGPNIQKPKSPKSRFVHVDTGSKPRMDHEGDGQRNGTVMTNAFIGVLILLYFLITWVRFHDSRVHIFANRKTNKKMLRFGSLRFRVGFL